MPAERLEKIEERVAWLEHHVTQQDKAMLELAKRLDRLQAELGRLRERAGEGGDAARSVEDVASDRPPHY